MAQLRSFVLVVDDKPPIADTLVAILRLAGFLATACYSPTDALALVRTFRPDFLLCDIVLGEVSGIETAIAARALAPECRILLMSGNVASNDLLEQARISGYEFLVLAKPFQPQELLSHLRPAWESRSTELDDEGCALNQTA